MLSIYYVLSIALSILYTIYFILSRQFYNVGTNIINILYMRNCYIYVLEGLTDLYKFSSKWRDII